MKRINPLAATLAFALSAAVLPALAQQQASTPPAAAATAQDKVVYHIDNTEAQATKGLRNIRNHLDTAPNTKVIVVTHADGVDFLMEGAKDKKNPNIDYASLVSALKSRGVRFEVCEITLKNRNLKKEQFTMDADFTPSGVVRVAQLQTREAYAYIKP
jgi:intracellular sulfur oxidation DsrE/DsrF family protein